jgi:hypothetical protein
MNGGCWLVLRTRRLHRSSATMCDANGTSLETKESALLVDETEVRVRALEDAIVVPFLINPKARVTHAGTIGH